MLNSNKEIYLISGVNEPYLENASTYIESMNKRSGVHNIIVTLDFSVSDSYAAKYENVQFIELTSKDVLAQNPNTCLQHGGFLPALGDLSDDDIIVFTDADIEVQRDFDAQDLQFLNSLEECEVSVGYNASPEQTLVDEAEALSPNVNMQEIVKSFPDSERFSVFNTGVIAARKSAFKRLYDYYVERWEEVDSYFGHYAKQQWLLSYLIQKRFKVKLMPGELHTHNHRPMGLRITKDYGHKFCIADTVVILAHHIPAVSALSALEKQAKKEKKLRRTWRLVSIIMMFISLILSITLAVLLMSK